MFLSTIRDSLQKKLILLFIIIATVPLLAASIFSFQTSRNTLMAEIEEQNMEAALALGQELDLMLEARLKLLHAASKDDDITSMDPARMVDNVKAYAAQYGDMPVVIISDSTGKQIYRNQGTLGNIADRQYFQDIKSAQPFSISDVLFAKATGKSSVILSVPLHNAQGQWIGLISGVMDLQHLSNLIARKKIGETGYAFIVDKTGKVLAHPNAEFVKELKDMTNVGPVQKAIQSQSGNAYYTYDGIKKVAGYAFVPLCKWGVIVQISEEEALAGTQKIKDTAIATAVAAIILAAILGIIIARVITRPINQMVQASETVAAGDLTYTVTIDSRDEIGKLAKSFNTMVVNLRNLVTHVITNAETVAASAQQLSASAQEATKAVEQIASTAGELAAGAQNQTREVASAVHTVEELARSAGEVATKAEFAVALSRDMTNSAQTGNSSVQKAVEQMTEINQAVSGTADIVKELGQRSKEIGNIVEVITGIAGQTNLLALNAAIEAARAGEQGRGFAVVADEVRKLAEQAQTAAGQIAEIIGHIQGQTDSAVSAMECGTGKVSEGMRVAREAGEAIDGILTKVGESVGVIQGISVAAEVQALGTANVVRSINDIAAVADQSSAGAQTAAAATEEMTASMEEIAVSSQALAETAAELQVIVQKFHV